MANQPQQKFLKRIDYRQVLRHCAVMNADLLSVFTALAAIVKIVS
jgi:hypothetical protein